MWLTVHLTASGTFISRSSVRDDAPAPAFTASEVLDESCYGGVRLEAKPGQHLMVQNAFVAAMKTPDEHDKLRRPHDQSSSASGVTAGALGFLTLIQ